MSVKLGYACINMTLKESDNIYVNRTTTVKKVRELGVSRLIELAKKNLDDLLKILVYNEAHGIRFYRLSSDMFPHLGNPKVPHYDIDFAKDILAQAGKYARDHGHRITMHPGQYTQLGSPNNAIIEQSIIDLNNHARILTMMGMSSKTSSTIIIHGGGVYGDKKKTLDRIIDNFNKLSNEAKDMLIFENDDHHYTILDLMPVCEKLNVPLCIDFFHHECNGAHEFDITDELLDRINHIWLRRGIKQKCHISSQKKGARKGAHSNCMHEIPAKVIEICKKYSIDIMVEAKDKELCVLNMYEKHYTKNIYTDGPKPRIEWMII